MPNLNKLITPKKNAVRKKIINSAVLIFAITASIVIIINRDKFSGLGSYGYLGIFLINLLGSSTIILPAPSILSTWVAGSLLNPFIVGLISALGASIGELTGYFAGMGGKVLIKKDSKYQIINNWMQKRGQLTIFILAAIPNPFFDIAGISAGITDYPLKKFIFVTFLGKLLKYVLVALLGLSTGKIIG